MDFRINAAAGREWIEVDAEMEMLLDLCDSLFFMTGGVLDPTALPLIRLWDYQAAQPRVDHLHVRAVDRDQIDARAECLDGILRVLRRVPDGRERHRSSDGPLHRR